MKSILLIKRPLGLVEMMSGLVNSSFSLPEWQAVKMNFFAPCHVFSKNGHHGKLCYTFFSLDKTPEGAYAGCVGVRKNYHYVEWQWKVE